MDIQKRILFCFLVACLFPPACPQSSFQFPDQETYLSARYQAELSLSEFSLECWLRRSGEGIGVNTGRGGVVAIPVISKGTENLSRETSLNLFLGIRKEDGVLVFDFESSGTSAIPFRNDPVTGYHTLGINQWYHVAVTYDKNVLRLFLNGKLESAREIGFLPSADDTSALVIGGMAGLSGEFTGRFIGSMDELRIWNYARTQNEIVEDANREMLTVEKGLITRIGFNEGTGNTISGIGAITKLEFDGTGGWAEGAPFNAPVPPLCEDSVIMKIGLITDPQYCDCDPAGTRFYRETLNKLPAAIDSMNKFQVDFVVNLGDMIDKYYESYDPVHQLYQNLTMPFYNVLGNHEFEEIHDTLLPSVVPRYGMPDYYYGFNHKNWRFLILDGTELAAYTRSLHPELAGEGDSLFQQVQDSVNNRPWNGGIGREQRSWMRDQIQSAHDHGQKVILFCHFPLYPDTVDLNLWNHEEIMALIEDYPNVAAYINGHFHTGNYGFRKGIHYVNQAAMLDTWETNSFSLLEVHTDKLVFKGFGFNPDRILTYEDHFKIPFHFDLTDTLLKSSHHAGSFIGRFYSASGSGIQYTLTPGSPAYKNEWFLISHDSLFLNTGTDLSLLEVIPIQVFAVTCSCDTVSEVFRLKYDKSQPGASELQDKTLPGLYPNPLSGILYIDLDGPVIDKPFELIITDMNGRSVKIIDHYNVDPFTGIIEVTLHTGIPAGMYLVKLLRPSQKDVSGKFIVRE